MKKLLFSLMFIGCILFANAQEESEWKPYMLITGYINTVAEYTDLQNFKDLNKDMAIGLADAGVLLSYKPLPKVEIKSTLVYTHYISNIQSLLVEAYGTYRVNDYLKFGAGKFLTPLSPVNQYFYAPVNVSGILPMVVSHHFLLPQSISGFQISGVVGADIKAGYNITYGSYLTSGHPKYGVLAIQGFEDIAPTVDPEIHKNFYNYYLGGSGRAFLNFKDMLNVGVNYFDGTRATMPITLLTDPANNISVIKIINSKKYSLGFDMQMNYRNLKINGEYWYGENKEIETNDELSFNYSGYYVEAMYEAGIFTPFIRYDVIDDLKSPVFLSFPDNLVYNFTSKATSIGGGVAIRPMYELMIKLDYRHLTIDYSDNSNNFPKSYNHGVLSVIYSF